MLSNLNEEFYLRLKFRVKELIRIIDKTYQLNKTNTNNLLKIDFVFYFTTKSSNFPYF